MCTAITITIATHLSPLVWRPLSTTDPTIAAPSLSTAEKCLSLAPQPNTIGVGSSGWSPCVRILGTAFFKHKYLTNPLVTPDDRVIAEAGALAQALDNRMPPHMHESTIQALSDLQDVFQQAAINYNADPTTHVILAASPKVPLNALPEPASPTAPPRVGTIKLSPRPSPFISNHRTISDPRVCDSPTTPVVPTRLDFSGDSLSL